MASIARRGEKWWVRWRERQPDGRWRDHSLTVPRKREANQLKRDIEAALATAGTFRPSRVRCEADGLELMVAGFLEHSSRVHASRTTIRKGQMLGVWLRFLRYTGAPLWPSSLTYDMLSEFHAWLLVPKTGRHVHARGSETCRKMVCEVEVFWKWSFRRQQRGDWSGVPYPDSLELRKSPPAEKSAPTWEEMDRAIAACRGWHQRVAILLRCTGLRVSQVMGMRWDDIDLEAGTLHVRPELGKSSKEKRGRRVPIAPVLVEQLAGWGVREGYVVPPTTGTRAADARVYRARDMNRAWRRAGVREEAWKGSPDHCFRAGFDSGLKRLGADDEAVEYLTGHSRGIREHYVGPDALPLAEAVALVPELAADRAATAIQLVAQ